MASEPPDQVETYEVPCWAHCQASLAEIESVGDEERQGFEIPAIRIEGTAHRAEIKVCPRCGSASKRTFPKSVSQNAKNVFEAIRDAFDGHPLIPSSEAQ